MIVKNMKEDIYSMTAVNPADVPKIRLSNGREVPCMGMGTFGSDRFTPDQVSSAVYGAVDRKSVV